MPKAKVTKDASTTTKKVAAANKAAAKSKTKTGAKNGKVVSPKAASVAVQKTGAGVTGKLAPTAVEEKKPKGDDSGFRLTCSYSGTEFHVEKKGDKHLPVTCPGCGANRRPQKPYIPKNSKKVVDPLLRIFPYHKPKIKGNSKMKRTGENWEQSDLQLYTLDEVAILSRDSKLKSDRWPLDLSTGEDAKKVPGSIQTKMMGIDITILPRMECQVNDCNRDLNHGLATRKIYLVPGKFAGVCESCFSRMIARLQEWRSTEDAAATASNGNGTKKKVARKNG